MTDSHGSISGANGLVRSGSPPSDIEGVELIQHPNGLERPSLAGVPPRGRSNASKHHKAKKLGR